MQPVIKWSGSKRSQAPAIASYITKDYKAYWEPFCGSCAMLIYILENMPERFQEYHCSDLNRDLINAYNRIKSDPDEVSAGYQLRWHVLNQTGRTIEEKKRYFESIRDRLNREHDPHDFIFVMRTTTNGMPRYNRNGDFNNSFHVTRDGILPETFAGIVDEWSELLNRYDVRFECRGYDAASPSPGDLVYMDPPYAATKGMYFGGFDQAGLYAYLEKLDCDWMMSYDGVAGTDDMTADVPVDLYKSHVLLDSGNSSFRRVIGKDRHCDVKESLYLSFEPDETGTQPALL